MKCYTHFVPLTAAFFSTLLFTNITSAMDYDKTIEDALKFGDGGAIKADINYRWENVDQDLGAKTANANTIRTRLGVLSPKFLGFQGFAEYEGTHALQADYNDGRNNKPAFSNIGDPAQNELNQLWLSYSILDTVIKGGRQKIEFDDHRFISGVPWRQLENTLDAVLITNKSLKNLTINAGYIGNVQTLLSTTENISAPILNVNYKLGDYGNVIGYGYWFDYSDPSVVIRNKSNQTFGLRLNGETPKLYDHYSLLYTAEWSIQQDYGHRAIAYEANRYNVMGGFTAYFLKFQGAMEQLNGNGVSAFFTPIGANHLFQGWADLFAASTPKDGLRDVFGTVSAKVWDDSVILTGIYHDFTDDTGQQHYGDEWDFQAVKKFGKHYSVMAKYAYYNADLLGTGVSNNTDTQKIWLQGNINF
jgi:hypothetical protein